MSQSDSVKMEAQEEQINILLATFAGLNLPRTMSLQVSPTATVDNVLSQISARLPSVLQTFIVSTNDNRQLLPSCHDPITNFTGHGSRMLPLRLSLPLCGGKGGFGSQLRAAGGRMSSRKNRNQQENASGSNRNLDGRRLRTVDEAKKLADYLAIKPEMEKREKEERKKRWEAVVEAADRREAEIKSGKAGAGGGRLDAEWVEGKEDAEEKTREAVLRAMREMEGMERTGSESSASILGDGDSDQPAGEGSPGSSPSDTGDQVGGARSFFGWDDEDDEDESDGEDAGEDGEPSEKVTYEGKGKAKAKA
ncbi:hypothetical protein K431DRAFT_287609 [Polychaeton citri CBS 116435]|uniref:Sde2 N-terminal ubiquitin domain-containing protein n=1 Tax=Polychaeton citri CBS 116435 TaxID=1314669 RepID=A0A9P4UM34_9PEZI|nr:hypothetical protein K431DRAFT_287609 [Polychaeton citri CBS 116435]